MEVKPARTAVASLAAAASVAALVALGLVHAPTASAGDKDINSLTIPSEAELRDLVSDLKLFVDDLALPEADDVARKPTQAAEKGLDLSSDVLFAFGSATVAPSLAAKMTDLLKDIPSGAAVSVSGHTDSVGDDASNQALSTQRAEAVAAVIRAARPDLVLTVAGFGETKPVAPNESGGVDDPVGREKNRRVELRYS